MDDNRNMQCSWMRGALSRVYMDECTRCSGVDRHVECDKTLRASMFKILDREGILHGDVMAPQLCLENTHLCTSHRHERHR